jgi:hypothetical protein
VKLHNATSYACRNRYGSAYQPLSEHALANALDVSEFVLASGGHITALDSWPKVVSTPPAPVPNPARYGDSFNVGNLAKNLKAHALTLTAKGEFSSCRGPWWWEASH